MGACKLSLSSLVCFVDVYVLCLQQQQRLDLMYTVSGKDKFKG